MKKTRNEEDKLQMTKKKKTNKNNKKMKNNKNPKINPNDQNKKMITKRE